MIKEKYEGLDKIHQRATLNAMNFDLNKSVIAIVSAQSEMVFSHTTLDSLVKYVSDGVIAAGATPKVVHVATVGSSTSYGTAAAKYDLPMRENIAQSIEVIASCEMIDGFVFVASDPSTCAGMLLGAVRTNIPSIFVSGGVMSPIVNSEGVNSGTSFWYTAIGEIKSGKINVDQFESIDKKLPTFLGTNCEEYAPNSFNCLLEALGLALMGNSTLFATGIARQKLAQASGEWVVKMVQNNLTPSKMLTKNSLTAAMCLDLALGGCTSTQLHLLALSTELFNCHKTATVDFKKLESLCKTIPILAQKGNTKLGYAQDFFNAGGVYAVLHELELGQYITCDYTAYNGKSMSEIIAKAKILDDNIIRTPINPVSTSSNIRVLYGNIAENGALMHFNGDMTPFVGPAKVYENEEIATTAILEKEIKKGNVLVIKNEGAKACPGMREIFQPFAILKGMGLDKDVAVITDGRISAGMYDGIAVGHITPECGEGGALTIVEDGDIIEISPQKCKINVDLKAREISRRNPSKHIPYGAGQFLEVYAQNVTSATVGAVLKTGK